MRKNQLGVFVKLSHPPLFHHFVFNSFTLTLIALEPPLTTSRSRDLITLYFLPVGFQVV